MCYVKRIEPTTTKLKIGKKMLQDLRKTLGLWNVPMQLALKLEDHFFAGHMKTRKGPKLFDIGLDYSILRQMVLAIKNELSR